jgi:hypothetical protein
MKVGKFPENTSAFLSSRKKGKPPIAAHQRTQKSNLPSIQTINFQTRPTSRNPIRQAFSFPTQKPRHSLSALCEPPRLCVFLRPTEKLPPQNPSAALRALCGSPTSKAPQQPQRPLRTSAPLRFPPPTSKASAPLRFKSPHKTPLKIPPHTHKIQRFLLVLHPN